MKRKNTKQTKITKQTKSAKTFICFVIFVCFVFSSAPSQTASPVAINGRWSLTMETDIRRSEMIADLRAEGSGTARLVILSPAYGEDGLFTGKITGDQLRLKGRYNGSSVEFELSLNGDHLSGRMAGDNWRGEIQGQRAQMVPTEISRRRYGLLFDAIWNGINQNFYDSKLTGIDQVAIRQQHRPRVKAARNDAELTVAIRQMLRDLKTSHTDFYFYSGNPDMKLKSERIAWKQLSPDVGHLALYDFTADDLMGLDKQLDRVMDEVVKRPALVLDLRRNRGESLEAAVAALNLLLPENRPVAYFATRNGMAKLGVSSIDQINPSSLPKAPIDNQVEVSKFYGMAGMYTAGGKYKRPYRGRIALLINEGCVGSCELFAAAMKEAGVATLIGRRTRGALLFSIPVTLSTARMAPIFKSSVKGWQMDLPVMEVRTAGRAKIEGKGVEPDISVARVSTGDTDLERAMQWIRK